MPDARRGRRSTGPEPRGPSRDLAAELRACEERNHLLFTHNPLPMWVFDDESLAFLEVNEAAIRTYGYSREQFLALTIRDIRPEEDVPRLLEARAADHAEYRKSGVWRHRRSNGEVFHVQIVRHRFDRAGRPVHLVVAADVTERVEAEEHLRASREVLRRFSDRLQSALEEERSRIARELHDELGQSLTVLRMNLAWLAGRVDAHDEKIHELIAAMNERVDETSHAVRRISTELRPGVLDTFGLVPALEWLARDFTRRTRLPVELEGDLGPGVSVPADRAVHVFRIVQEALTNVVRHATATRAGISISVNGADVIVEIADDGRGFDPAPDGAGMSLGLVGMRERAHLLGGTCTVSGTPGSGTRVTLRFPRDSPSRVPA